MNAIQAAWRHVLVVRLDNMGDVLMCTPAMRALREAAPEARVTLLTSPAGARLAPHLDMADAVTVFRAPWVKPAPGGEVDDEQDLVNWLRNEAIDVAVIMTSATQSPLPMALLCRMAGIPVRAAHARENPYALLSHWVRDHDALGPGMRHEVLRQIDLVRSLGVPGPSSMRLGLGVRDTDRMAARNALLAAGVVPGGPYIVVHPGATAASRRYPAAMMGEAMRGLVAEGWTCVFCGSADERAAVQLAREAIAGPTVDLSGRLTLGELAALIEGASLLVCNNSGPAHMAAALGTPVVCLYALTNPQHTPWLVPRRLLSREVPCRNCLQSVCPEPGHPCLTGVPPRDVAMAARALLAQPGTVDDNIDAHAAC